MARTRAAREPSKNSAVAQPQTYDPLDHLVEASPSHTIEVETDLAKAKHEWRKRHGEPVVMDIPPSELLCDDYQRPVQESFVAGILQHGWDVHLAHVLTCNMRDSMDIYIVDGKQRWTAAKRLGIATLRCQVWDGMSYEEEASYFRAMQKLRRSMKVEDDFRAALRQRDPEALDIQRIVHRHGLRISVEENVRGRRIEAIAAIRSIYRASKAEGLSLVLGWLMKLWPDENEALAATNLNGFYQLLSRHPGDIKFDKLELLGRYTMLDVRREESRARNEDPTRGATIGRYIGFVRLYNKNVRQHKLIPRDKSTIRAGELGGRSKLTDLEALAILRAWVVMPQNPHSLAALAEQYEVSAQTIRDIVNRKSFKHLQV